MPEELTRTQRRQKETKERIFRVAMELFSQHGFEQTTVADITEAADIGKGTFFTYFPTKESVFGQLGEAMLERMLAVADQGSAAGLPAGVILKNVLLSTAGWLEANRPVTRQVVRSGFSQAADFPNQRRLFDLLVELVNRGQAAGELNAQTEPADAAVVLAGAYFGMINYWAAAEGLSLPDRLAAAVDVVLNGLRVGAC